MQLRHRLQLLFLALATIVVCDVALDRYLVASSDNLREEVAQRWEPARTEAVEVLFGLIDQEAGQRGFLITGREQFLEPYHSGGERADLALTHLNRLLADDSRIGAQLRRTQDRVSAYRQLGAVYEIQAKRSGRDAEVRALVAAGTSARLFQEARLEIDDLRLVIIEGLREREDEATRLEDDISALRVTSAVLALSAVLLFAFLVHRWLSAPLAAVTSAARVVAGGDLDHQIPATGPPELSGLGRDVDRMRRRILAEVDEATRARSSLAGRGMIVLALRDELAPAAVVLPESVRVATRFRPATSIVAGDWYEVRESGGAVTFVLADVSGHGPKAGVFALKTKQLVQIGLDQGLAPAACWAWVASRLGDTGDQFVTGVIGVVDASTGVLTYASAGHPPLLTRTADRIDQLMPTGPILGGLAGASWHDNRVGLMPGSALIAYSDGLLEARGGDGSWADLDGLIQVLRSHETHDVEELADLCLEFRDSYSGGIESDDLTVVVVGVEGQRTTVSA
ncbi:MAG TPA: SpoIIE family protein phosphatase [Acidimicrobiales bacterium]|nr:SpoIIE family protein phosphatase [Acidimicrobiales bacterium]